MQREWYLLLKSEICQEHSAPSLLWALSYIVCTSLLDMSWNIARLLKYFPRRSPALCLRGTCYFHLYSARFPGTSYWRRYRFGCGYESHLEQAAMEIGLGVHIHAFPRELFIEYVRRLLEDSTGETRSWNFSANTWGQDFCTHLCTHQRHRILYCQAGVTQADN